MSEYFKLRDYQQIAVDQFMSQGFILEFDDMRLGKTLTVLAGIERMGTLPCIIAAPTFALYVWEAEIADKFGKPSLVYWGNKKKRTKQWEEFLRDDHEYIITTYAMLDEVMNISKGKIKWNALICDEIHMYGLLNHKTATFAKVKEIGKTVKAKALITGTPYRNGVVDLYGPLHLVDHKKFPGYWNYVNKYCVTIKEMFGTSIERNPKNLLQFKEMIKPYVVRRKRQEVYKDLPDKQRQIINVVLDEEERAMYDKLRDEFFVEHDDGFIYSSSGLGADVKARQLLVCPKMLGINNYGQSIIQMTSMIQCMPLENNPVVIFTPFRKAISFIREYLDKKIKKIHYYEIKGKMTAQEHRNSWQGFQKDKYNKKIMICVIKSAAAFKADVADTAFFIGCEWDFTLNHQAEDRLIDVSQNTHNHYYYMLHKNTIEQEQIVKLQGKEASAILVIDNLN